MQAGVPDAGASPVLPSSAPLRPAPAGDSLNAAGLSSQAPASQVLLETLWSFARRVRSYEAPEGGGLSMAQVAVLFRLERRGPARLTEVAQDMRLDLSVASRQVAELHEAGLVQRARDPRDGRAVQLQITARGSQVVDEMRRRRDEWISHALADWDDEQILQAARMIAAIQEVIRDPGILAPSAAWHDSSSAPPS